MVFFVERLGETGTKGHWNQATSIILLADVGDPVLQRRTQRRARDPRDAIGSLQPLELEKRAVSVHCNVWDRAARKGAGDGVSSAVDSQVDSG